MTQGQSYRRGMQLVTAPDCEPIDLAAAKRHLYEDGDHQDAEIRGLITEARQWVENQTEAQLITATWTMTLDRFPRSKWLDLPRWPARTVEAIRYVAPDGSDETIDLTTVVLRKETAGRARIARKNWASWPTTASTPDAVEIEFTAGFGDPSDVPPLWHRPILLLIGHWYENREAVINGSASNEVKLAVESLIESLRSEDDFCNELDLG